MRGDRARRADGADRERARLRRRRRRPDRARAVRARARARAGRAARALHRHVRGVSGARSAVRGDARHVLGDAARRAASCSRADGRIRSRAARAQARARRHRRGASIFAGQRPRRRDPRCSSTPPTCSSRRAARGTNTPLKIYQYLRSGRPIVATRLLTHTQVLDDEVAILTARDAGGIRRRDPRGADRSRARARAVGDGARELAETKYSYEAYLDADAPGLRRT